MALTRLLVILVSAIVASLAAYVIAINIPRTYQSAAILLVGQPFASNYDALLADQLRAQTFADLATTSIVLDKVIDQVDLGDSTASVASRVVAAASRGSNIVKIGVTDTNADRAARIANAIAAQLITMTAESTGASKNLALIEPAVASATPSWPRIVPMTAAGGALGILLALVVMVRVDYVRPGDKQSARP